MRLVVGGVHSGKRTFVREKLGFAADDFVDAAQLARRFLESTPTPIGKASPSFAP